MIESIYFKIGLVIIGIVIVLSGLIDFRGLISNLVFKSKTPANPNKQNDFLEIVELWYKLKNKCDQCNLNDASDKLDEVFPLLNGVPEDEKIA